MTRVIAIGLMSLSIAAITACGSSDSDGSGSASGSSAGDTTAAPDDLTRDFGTPDAEAICQRSPAKCGDAPETAADRSAVGVAILELQRAFLEGDARALCARMTKKAQTMAGELGYSTPSKCELDLPRAFEFAGRRAGWEGLENPRVASVDVDGDLAVATVEGDGRVAEVPMQRVDGRWKLAAFFGADAPRSWTSPAIVEKRPPPAARAQPVRVVDVLNGGPCEEPTTRGFPDVEGGCEIALIGNRVPLSIMTPFGAFLFDSCVTSFGLRVGPTGEAWTYYWFLDNQPDDDTVSGCNNTNQCPTGGTDDAAGAQPIQWRGRVESEGGDDFSVRLSACLTTWVGDFTGELTVQLRRAGDGWRAEFAEADIGRSGAQFDGPLEVKPKGVDIRPAS